MGLSGSSVYGGNATTATSTDGNDSIVLSSSVSNSFVQGNGGNDTMYVGSSVFGGSSVYGGQGVDLISVVGTVTGSTVGGNLGNDTIELLDVAKGATIYGGGGFEYDTSLDGADSIILKSKLSAGALIQANGGNDLFTSLATSSNPPFTADKALTTSLEQLLLALSPSPVP